MSTSTPPEKPQEEDKVVYTHEQMNGYVFNYLHMPARLLGCRHIVEGTKQQLMFSTHRTHYEQNHCDLGKNYIYIDSGELEHHWKSREPLQASIVEALEDLNNPIWTPYIEIGEQTTRRCPIGEKELPRYLDVDLKLESKDKLDVEKKKVYDVYTLGAGLVGREFRISGCFFTPSPESFQQDNITHASTAQTSTRLYLNGSARPLFDSKVKRYLWQAKGRDDIKF